MDFLKTQYAYYPNKKYKSIKPIGSTIVVYVKFIIFVNWRLKTCEMQNIQQNKTNKVPAVGLWNIWNGALMFKRNIYW